jgi:hypothetical protein
MATYIANINGDWWEYFPEHPIYVLNTDNLSEDEIDDVEIIGSDGFEAIVMTYGEEVSLSTLIGE